MTEPRRPDPDALLARLRAEGMVEAGNGPPGADARPPEGAPGRGRLRIYFGAAAGVGKTFAMLAAARRAQADGTDVLVGLVETHGRAETLEMVAGLPLLPRRTLAQQGVDVSEFDLDAALARHPGLLLVDELAHSNPPGARHPKRWQDVEELVAAGITVWTTLNVQHLESLNDVVGGITGVRVLETLPDRVFDAADEVTLVDLPAEELLARLAAGKVYRPQQAARAARHFFRRGNLVALREIALRRTAERVEDDVQSYRATADIAPVWKTGNGLLACVGPGPAAGAAVRAAARLAGRLNAPWQAVHVETPRLARRPPAARERAAAVLRLAETLGAETAILSGADVAAELARHARRHNVSQLVVGPGPAGAGWAGRWRGWLPALGPRLARAAPELDVTFAGSGDAPAVRPLPVLADADDPTDAAPPRWTRYLWTLVLVAGVTLAALPLAGRIAPTNVVMFYLLAVIGVAMRFGRGAAGLAALASVLLFDFTFVSPRFSFAVSDAEYLLTFAVMLVVGLVIGQLTARLRFAARVAGHREARAQVLFAAARDLAAAGTARRVVAVAVALMERTFGGRAAVLLPDAGGRLHPPARDERHDDLDASVAQWVLDHAEPAGFGTGTLPAGPYHTVPLKTGPGAGGKGLGARRDRADRADAGGAGTGAGEAAPPDPIAGVLALRPFSRRRFLGPEAKRLFDTLVSLVAAALARVRLAEAGRDLQLASAAERQRSAFLAAVSHDLRTPLTGLLGLTEALARSQPPLPAPQQALVGAVHAAAGGMSAMVTNLLDMARLDSRAEQPLLRDWQSAEELIGSALAATEALRAGGPAVRVEVAAGLPMVRADAGLVTRALVNLLENAARHAPGAALEVAARLADGTHPTGRALEIGVADRGPGLPPGLPPEALFEKFRRGRQESATPGTGLGLAIVRAVAEAHGGSGRAEARAGGGARFVLRLPLAPDAPADESAEPDEPDEAHGEGVSEAAAGPGDVARPPSDPADGLAHCPP